jgi:endo-1,4-beta-xylanase
MKQHQLFFLLTLLLAAAISCKKGDVTPPTPPQPLPVQNTDTTLKGASPVPIGIAIGHNLFLNNATYRNIVKREADRVTFDYHMKHGAIVRDDGSFDYSRADELFNLATSEGLEVYGHTLVWHENQNGNHLRSLTVGTPDPNAPNLLPEGNFESGTGTSGTGTTLFAGWNLLVSGSAAGSFAAVAGYNSTRALQVTVGTPGANAYDIQAIGPQWTAIVGKQYTVSVDIKASVANGKVRLVNQAAQYQQSELTPTASWATYTWTLSALETAPLIRLNFPEAGVYTFDNLRITDATAGTALPAAEVAKNVDTAMSRFIRNTAGRYAGKVKAWDVVNEAFNDGSGTIRTNAGNPAVTGDKFYWAQYLGRDFGLKAFQYAKAADPSALLFINDYNLETDNRKLDSLLAYVAEIKTKGAMVDGIGTQMHISINTPQSGIDNMFRKMAASGLRVKVTELDVRINPSNATGFTPTTALLASQAAMYRYVAETYFRLVPAAQRYGITVWGVADTDSWLYNNGRDFPLLFDKDYNKKPAFLAFLQGLKTR